MNKSVQIELTICLTHSVDDKTICIEIPIIDYINYVYYDIIGSIIHLNYCNQPALVQHKHLLGAILHTLIDDLNLPIIIPKWFPTDYIRGTLLELGEYTFNVYNNDIVN